MCTVLIRVKHKNQQRSAYSTDALCNLTTLGILCLILVATVEQRGTGESTQKSNKDWRINTKLKTPIATFVDGQYRIAISLVLAEQNLELTSFLFKKIDALRPPTELKLTGNIAGQ